MEGLGVTASVIAVVNMSAKVVGWCAKYAGDVKNSSNEKVRLLREVTELNYVAQKAKSFLEGPHGVRLQASTELLLAITVSESQLQQLERKLKTGAALHTTSGVGLRALKWPFQSKGSEKAILELRRCTERVSMALQIDQTYVVIQLSLRNVYQHRPQFSALILDGDQKRVLDRLPVAENASFDSHAQEHHPICLPNTRFELLSRISDWAEDLRTESIFWLNGMAGTGKSTISRTVAQSSAEKGHLGASFFFKRGEADRAGLTQFFTTIAADLVVRQPTTAYHIKDALDTNPSIIRKTARTQFDELFEQPLLQMNSKNTTENNPVVVVVDALDECGQDDDIELLITLFSRAKNIPRLKLFLTGRPELPLRLGFNAIKGNYQVYFLHEIPRPIIEHDISAFLEHELAKIRGRHNGTVPADRQLAADWPGQSRFRSLVDMAFPLFVFAATMCRFLAERRNPEEQLKKLLEYQTESQKSKLNATYLPVLDQQIIGLGQQQTDEVIQEFRDIVGPMIILASPLSASALARILSMPRSTIDGKLDMLHSVLNVPSSAESPVRLLHVSFRDFLVTSEKHKTNPFWIDERRTHEAMATRCLNVLDRLKQDLCNIKAPGTPRSTVESRIINACLPAEVQYACLYWVYHIREAGSRIADGRKEWRFLTSHLLHWIEALSLMGRALESLSLIKSLQLLLEVSQVIFTSCYVLIGLNLSLKIANISQTCFTMLHSSSALMFQLSILRLFNYIPPYLLSHRKEAKCELYLKMRWHIGYALCQNWKVIGVNACRFSRATMAQFNQLPFHMTQHC